MNNLRLAGSGEDPATIVNPALKPELQGFLQVSDSPALYFSRFLPNIIGLAFAIGVIVFFFMMLVGAIQWMTAGGDKASLEAARGRLSAAAIGLIILFSLFAITALLENFFGINILTIDVGVLKID